MIGCIKHSVFDDKQSDLFVLIRCFFESSSNRYVLVLVVCILINIVEYRESSHRRLALARRQSLPTQTLKPESQSPRRNHVSTSINQNHSHPHPISLNPSLSILSRLTTIQSVSSGYAPVHSALSPYLSKSVPRGETWRWGCLQGLESITLMEHRSP